MFCTRVNKRRLFLMQGDITLADCEAIVNAANNYLKHGGGVAGAIVRRGGAVIQEESDAMGYVQTGQAVITDGGNLKARYVIHAVGPRQGEGNEDQKLQAATRSVLRIVGERKIKSVAFPAISTGIFGYSVEKCARIMLKENLDFLRDYADPLDVYFYLYNTADYTVFYNTLSGLMS